MKKGKKFRNWVGKILRYLADQVEEKGEDSDLVKHSLGDRKVFIIGYNKTGTTSLKRLFLNWGFKVGDEAVGHILTEDWLMHGRTDRILKYAALSQVFQDKPFSTDGLYKVLDEAFPDALFILTIRQNEDVWYNSWVQHHINRYNVRKDGGLPTMAELKNDCTWLYKGYIYDSDVMQWGEENMYNQALFKRSYLQHIEDVRNHFKDRPNKCIELCISQKGEMQRLKSFLGIESRENRFPHENQGRYKNVQ